MAKTVEVGETAYDFLRGPYLKDKSKRESENQQPQPYAEWLAEQIGVNEPEWIQQRFEGAKALPMRGC